MNKFLLTTILLFVALVSFTQDASLNGTVEDASGEPMIQASIIVDAAEGLATITDFDGNYNLSLPAGEYYVLYRYLGKSDKIVTINLSAGENRTLNVVLEEKAELINTVVVSASKYEKKLSEETVSMEVLKSDLLESNNITDGEDAVAKVPGVTIVDGQANIRGGSGWAYGAGSRVLVLYDDLPLLSAEGGDAKWSLVPMENLETVEVIKGAASSIYGSGALNGVINFRTGWAKKEPITKFNVWSGVTHSPRDKKEAWWYERNDMPFDVGLNFLHKRKFGRLDLVWHTQYVNDRSHNFSGSNGNARLGQKLRFRPKKFEGLSMGVNVNAYRSWGSNFFLWNGPDSLARTPMTGTSSRYQSTRVIIDPFISYYDEKNNNFHFKFRYFNAKNETEDGQGSIPVNYYGELQYNRYFQKLKFNLVAGLAGFADVVKPENADEGSLSGNNRRFNIAPYAQIEKKLINDRLNLTLGMRYEYFKMLNLKRDSTGLDGEGNVVYGDYYKGKEFKSDLNRPLFRFGANFKAADYTYIRASWGEGYRFPNIAESFVNINLGGIGIYPNPNLEDEYGWYTELAVKQGFKLPGTWQGYADLSWFYMRYDNMIEVNFGQYGTTLNAENLFGLGFSFQNVGQTEILGTEFTIAGVGNIGKVPLQVLFGYTYSKPTSRNWDDEVTLYNEDGVEIEPGEVFLPAEIVSNILGTQINTPLEVSAFLPEASRDQLTTYAGTSSSTDNTLKYRNNHVVSLDLQSSFRKMDFGISFQLRSWMKNIDYVFVSPFLSEDLSSLVVNGLRSNDANMNGIIEPQEEGVLGEDGSSFEDIIDTEAFSYLREFREENEGQATTLLSLRMTYNFSEDAALTLIGNNLLNQTYSDRPGVLGQPINFAARFSYTFKGNSKKTKE